jgi:hypothetical protein
MFLSENENILPTNSNTKAWGLLMIRPVNFGFNPETASSNAFQNEAFGLENKDTAQEKALLEFDTFVGKLKIAGIEVLVIEDTLEPATPDSIFPNNWISFHETGTIITYPMQAINRRLERRKDIIESISQKFNTTENFDLSYFEQENKHLEGTGSMVLDRQKKLAYACLSPRTNKEVLNKFCEITGYKAIVFDAIDANGKAIYHTNVLMCVGTEFVVICMEAIPAAAERDMVLETIKNSGKELIEITLDQMNNFAGNMLEAANKNGEKYLIMSSSAYHSLTNWEIEKLDKYTKILHSDLTMIEGNGGGSARCMMAEIFLKEK